MSGSLTSQSNTLPVYIEDKGDRNERDRQEAQGRTRPPNTKVSIHRTSKQREPRPETASHEVVPCQDRSGVVGIGVAEIVQDRVEEQERTDGEEARCDDGTDPVDRGSTRPPEPEETYGDTECTHACRW